MPSFGQKSIPTTRKRHQDRTNGRVVFKHIQIKIINTREPLLGCGPLPDRLRKKRCIYAVDGKEERTDNIYV